MCTSMLYILCYVYYILYFIGYSQGGLIARGMIENYGNEHNVRTFVSLSSPQGGQYGGMYFLKITVYIFFLCLR